MNLFIEDKITDLTKIVIGGNKQVQIDETLIYKGRLITCPSNSYDKIPGCTWLVGLIEEGTGRMYIEIVPNRKISTISKLIEEHVFVRSTILTGGHPSYPTAVKNCFCNHKIVNHSIRFKNEYGYHTNNIENLWSQLKYYEKNRLGVQISYIKSFLNEFTIRYYFLPQEEYKDVGKIWFEILVWLINN